jgi:hypothetical protein
MTIAASTDYGLTWNIEGPIIVGDDPPAADTRQLHDGGARPGRLLYAFCLHNGGHSWDGGYMFAARAPASDPAPVMAKSPGSGTA